MNQFHSPKTETKGFRTKAHLQGELSGLEEARREEEDGVIEVLEEEVRVKAQQQMEQKARLVKTHTLHEEAVEGDGDHAGRDRQQGDLLKSLLRMDPFNPRC